MKAQASAVPERIRRLQQLVGVDAIFIPIRPRSKKPVNESWQTTTGSAMSDPKHLASLSQGNVAVLLGGAPGIYAIDCDSDEAAEEMMNANPWLRHTLRSAARRGCQFWLRSADSTRTRKLTRHDGSAFGELRGEGGYSLIGGTHPEGMPYRIMVKCPPAAVSLGSIVWPSSVRPPRFEASPVANAAPLLTEIQSNRATEILNATEVTDASKGDEGGDEDEIKGLEAVIQKVVGCHPARRGHNHAVVFNLGRAMKDVENDLGRVLTDHEVESFALAWWKQAAPKELDPDTSKADYLFQVEEAYENARYGLKENGANAAWKRAETEPLPKEAYRYDDPVEQRAVGLCFYLQQSSLPSPFFLSCRTLARLAGRSHEIAARWLRRFVKHHILEIDEVNVAERRATRYFYSSLRPRGDGSHRKETQPAQVT